MNNNDRYLQKLWDKFSNVPINENDEIEEDFHVWEKGTDRFSIWRWFDDTHSEGIIALQANTENLK